MYPSCTLCTSQRTVSLRRTTRASRSSRRSRMGTVSQFHSKHLQFIKHAIRNGVDVRGHFTWPFMDSYLDRFGLI
ncbi:hypothetical protein EJB05_43539, partial [Eragrostis curvula]